MGKNIIIAIDAGHGMKTPGKRCLRSLDHNETREWCLNDRIADRLQELLGGYGCTVLRVDDTTGSKDISLPSRVKTANNAKADIYISIHHNAGLSGRKGGGTVVYYSSEKAVRREQAKRFYDAVVGQTGLVGNRSEEVIKKGFYVIKYTSMPAFLIENGFMDSPSDVPIILSPEHAEKTAQGILSFLVSELRLEKKNGGNGHTDAQTGISSGTSTGGGNTPACGKYTVVGGDTLSGIGKKMGVPWKKIAEANGINSPYTIRMGQVLKIPNGVTQSKIYYPAYTGKKVTLSAALASLGISNTYNFRKQIAAANNIGGYVGTAAQNTQMYNLLTAGLLKK